MPANAFRSLTAIFLTVLFANVLRADDELRLFPSSSTIVQPSIVLSYVSQPAVRVDLKLTAEQEKRIEQLITDAQGVTPGIDPETGRRNVEQMTEQAQKTQETLTEILSPEQVRRHNQIVLQHLAITAGLSELLEIPEIGSVVLIDADQQQDLNAIRNTMQEAMQAAMQESLRERVLLRTQQTGIFTNPDVNRFADPLRLAELDEQTADQISGALTAVQKKRLLETLGPPLAGRLPPIPFVNRALVGGFVGGRGARGGGFRVAARGRGGRGGGFPLVRAPRLVTLPTREPWSGIGKQTLAESLFSVGLLAAESIRQELKLTAEEVDEHVLFGSDREELLRSAKQLDSWLKPAQLSRLRQLVLQFTVRQSGPAAVFEFREVVDPLQLSDEQRTALAESARAELQSTRHLVLQAIERDPEKLRELEKDVTERLSGLLTDPQRKQLAAHFGEPFRGELFSVTIDRALESRPATRARIAASLGYLTEVPASFLIFGPLRDELQLTEEQQAAIPESPFIAAAIAAGLPRTLPTGPDAKTLEVLSAGQLQRYKEILLQGGVRSDGPTMIFRYKFVIDALSPTEDQARRILKIVQQDTRDYLRIPLAELPAKQPDLDAATAKDLEAVLTDAQREKLANLLGEPAACLDQPLRPVRQAR